MGVFTFFLQEGFRYVGVFTFFFTFFIFEFQPGPAFVASQGLSVETAVMRRFVLCLAVIAQGESGHRRIRPVVRHGSNDRVARPALGAINEGIAMSTFMRRGQFLNAVITSIQIRWHMDLGFAG